jgi:hypothetical protein
MGLIIHQAPFPNSLQLRHNEYCQTEIISRNKMCKDQIIVIMLVQLSENSLREAGLSREADSPQTTIHNNLLWFNASNILVLDQPSGVTQWYILKAPGSNLTVLPPILTNVPVDFVSHSRTFRDYSSFISLNARQSQRLSMWNALIV